MLHKREENKHSIFKNILPLLLKCLPKNKEIIKEKKQKYIGSKYIF